MAVQTVTVHPEIKRSLAKQQARFHYSANAKNPWISDRCKVYLSEMANADCSLVLVAALASAI
jgi:hypothetical protein